MDNLTKVVFEQIGDETASITIQGRSVDVKAAILTVLQRVAELGGTDLLSLLKEMTMVARAADNPMMRALIELAKEVTE